MSIEAYAQSPQPEAMLMQPGRASHCGSEPYAPEPNPMAGKVVPGSAALKSG